MLAWKFLIVATSATAALVLGLSAQAAAEGVGYIALLSGG
jgi:hypothetical protein